MGVRIRHPGRRDLILGDVPGCCHREDGDRWQGDSPVPFVSPPLHPGTDLPVCASCGQGIYDGQYLQALNADWHADCFR